MSTTGSMLADELSATRQAQREAADPMASAWVAANAGTGKTHVLTARVLRLLVAGTRPERILCLTYTKAAAAEMSQRIFDRLARWVLLPDADLAAELEDLTGSRQPDDVTARARDLFSVAIETPGGLKVQTIHAFCERLLQRFPLEAGIAPKFTILDDETGRQLRAEAIETILRDGARSPDSPLGVALDTVIAWAVDETFDNLLTDILAKRDWLEAINRLDHEGDDVRSGAEKVLRRMLGIAAGSSVASVEASLASVLSMSELRLVRAALLEGGKSDKAHAQSIGEAIAAESLDSRIEALKSFFLTGEGNLRQRLLTNVVKDAHPEIEAHLLRAQDMFAKAYQERAALTLLEANVALLIVASAVMQRYADLKQHRAALDFDDLIRKTALLLSSSSQAQWVLYKLDGGLDHILVDEAQDTSPDQWKIIQALASEFFSGEVAEPDGVRTLFAVGDEKQSIYGFQGAAPEKFAEVGTAFEAAAKAAGHAWRRVPLTLSFRTTSPVLATVDRVFANEQLTRQVTAGGGAIRHAAYRLGAAGLVELWPPEAPTEAPSVEIWDPLAEQTIALPVARLADRIADTIKRWIDRGEMLASEGRPIRAGDVLILVRRRQPFAPAIVAALKARQIAVAGADRIRLADQTAMQDLLALGDFLLLPEDDLALATILKSPLFDFDDDDLLDIAPGRPRALWSALIRASGRSQKIADAVAQLKRWRASADLLPPFEFFAEILDRDGMRSRMLSRLGPEAGEPIDEFLRLAMSYDEGAPPSLQGFIAGIRSSDREIKRDMEHGRNEVRVMTVHGAKGLEAPIVFLPDTCSTRSGGAAGGLIPLAGVSLPAGLTQPFVWPVKGSKALAVIQGARNAVAEKEAAERNRLLYVALTRPRDRLYVCGFLTGNGKMPEDCWYELVRRGLEGLAVEGMDDDGRIVHRVESHQSAPIEAPRGHTGAIVETVALPDWVRAPAPREPSLAIPLAPSRLAPLESDDEGDPVERPKASGDTAERSRAEPPTMSPGAQSEGRRFLRGTITHGLLEYLPTLDPSRWAEVADGFVSARGSELSVRARKSIVAETIAVLRDPAFCDVFGPGSRAEVPIVAELRAKSGKGPLVRVTGQIDRLVVRDRDVLIVDFKTNRPPPTETSRVSEAYLLQLAAYRLAVAGIYPGKVVKPSLLWTDGPRLMPIPDALLDEAEARLFTTTTEPDA